MFTSVLVLNPHNLRLNKRRNVESPEEVGSNKSDRRATSRRTYLVTHRSSSRQAVYILMKIICQSTPVIPTDFTIYGVQKVQPLQEQMLGATG